MLESPVVKELLVTRERMVGVDHKDRKETEESLDRLVTLE